jgi:hypothetical protein
VTVFGTGFGTNASAVTVTLNSQNCPVIQVPGHCPLLCVSCLPLTVRILAAFDTGMSRLRVPPSAAECPNAHPSSRSASRQVMKLCILTGILLCMTRGCHMHKSTHVTGCVAAPSGERGRSW